MRSLMAITAALMLLAASCALTPAHARRAHEDDDHGDDGPPPDVDADVWAHVQRMTLEQRVGQMTQLNIDLVLSGNLTTREHVSTVNVTRLREFIRRFHVGSWLNSPLAARTIPGFSGLDPTEWRALIDTLERETIAVDGVPPLYGIDSVHGANYVRGATLFPHQINAAATFNERLVEQMGAITAKDTRAAGITWNFAPILDVAVQPTWPRGACARRGAAKRRSRRVGPGAESSFSRYLCVCTVPLCFVCEQCLKPLASVRTWWALSALR